MEKKIMGRKFMGGSIPIWEWKKMPLIRIGKDEFVTAKPVATGVRTFNEAREIASDFTKKNDCYATITYETEWLKVIEFLKVNYATKKFLEENNLVNNEAILLDSITEGDSFVLAAGQFHCLNEIFRGFISGDDSDGEPQPKKIVFLTIRILTE